MSTITETGPRISWVRLFMIGVLISWLIALAPLPVWLQPARPDVPVLLVVYWVLRKPLQFGIVGAWCVGLMLDGLEGGVLGKHALSLAVVAYATMIIRPRLAFYTLLQQVGVVMLLAVIDLLLNHWIQSLLGRPVHGWVFLLGCLSTAMCWPLIASGSRHLRQIEE